MNGFVCSSVGETQLDSVGSLWSTAVLTFRLQIRLFIDTSRTLITRSAWCRYRPSLTLKHNLFVPFWEHLPMCASQRPPYFLLTQSWTLFVLICTQSPFTFLVILNDSMVHVILKNKSFFIIFQLNLICSVSETTLLFSWHHFQLAINSWFISCFFSSWILLHF